MTMRIARTYPVLDGQIHKLEAEYGIRQLGDAPGYFSVTGSLYEPRPTRSGFEDEPVMAGAIHAELNEHMPWLNPLIGMHLHRADTGEPLHALSNSWYWFTAHLRTRAIPRSYRMLSPAQRAATYLGGDPLMFASDRVTLPADHTPTPSPEFTAAVDALRPIWRKRAQVTCAMYELTIPTVSKKKR